MPSDSNNQLLFAYKALKTLANPIEDLPAYKKGYIDKDGKRIISHWSDLDQSSYIKDYDIFTRFLILLKQFLEKLPAQQRRQFKYNLLLKSLRESCFTELGEVQGTEFLVELHHSIQDLSEESSIDLLNEINRLLFITESDDIPILSLDKLEDMMIESMTAGAIPSGGDPGIAGVNDAQEDPLVNTLVKKKKKKKKDPKLSKKTRKIIDKL